VSPATSICNRFLTVAPYCRKLEARALTRELLLVDKPKIDRIVSNLSRTVVVPRAPLTETRDQKSWRGLKVGQMLVNKVRLHYRDVWISEKTRFKVTKTTNKGVTLAPVGDLDKPVEWVTENWGDFFDRAPRR
jgi:hypothetical protein